MSSFNATVSNVAQETAYGYVPTFGVAVLFLVLFGISTLLHAAQAAYFGMWWLLPTACLCGVGELVGWTGRLWSSFAPALSDPYMMQIATTIIAPTPLIAVNFILLGRIIARLGAIYSRLTPKSYTVIFLTCDIIALVVQGLGGGIAASSQSLSAEKLGSNIMLGGIIFQFIALCVYTACGVDFLRNYLASAPVRPMISSEERGTLDTRLKIMIGAIGFSTLVLFIRSIYRIVELADGWNGKVITTEVYFNVLDGGMVTLAIFTMNIVHPGLFLGSGEDDGDREQTSMEQLPAKSWTAIAYYVETYPRVKTIAGDNDSGDILVKAAYESDVVIHAGNSDHKGGHGSSSQGTHLPEQRPHRAVDKIAFEAAAISGAHIHTEIICPTDIYGKGHGPDLTRSFTMPFFYDAVLDHRSAFYIGKGENTRSLIHIEDVMSLYVRVVEEAISSLHKGTVRDECWGKNGFYFCSGSELVWKDAAVAAGRVIESLGVIDSAEAKEATVDDIKGIFGGTGLGLYLFGIHARSRADRAKNVFDWKPTGAGFMEVIEADLLAHHRDKQCDIGGLLAKMRH
ncbi:RTA1-like protein [Mycena venus]|uniref:RTA1-like protein n=1 Tax=Mycena venus TaxID=2733690 RepID=A0A8H6XSY0_9AGAR|nr:RTA1-like protein [Mycena venus]